MPSKTVVNVNLQTLPSLVETAAPLVETTTPPPMPLSTGAMVALGSIASIATAYVMSPSLPVVGAGQAPAGFPQPGSPGGGGSPNSDSPQGIAVIVAT